MKSYLLALDGSEESLFAAELAWQLAETNHAKVVAQTVVDSQSLWQLVGKERPGIIGNGPYLAAHEAIHAALKNVSETLLAAYEARARGHDIESECVLDEGNILHEIVKRAQDHVVVIIGHRRGHEAQISGDKSWFPHYSLAEHLVYQCPKPLLIVQGKCAPWKTARLIVSRNTYDSSRLTTFFEFTKTLKLAQEIFCIAPEDSIDKFAADVRRSLPSGEEVHIMCHDQEQGDPAWECATDVPTSTLLVVATQETKDGRQTSAGTDPGSFIHKLRLPAVVVLPAPRAETLSSPSKQSRSLSKKN